MVEVSRCQNNRKAKQCFEQKRGKKEHIAVIFVLPRLRQAFEKKIKPVYIVFIWSLGPGLRVRRTIEISALQDQKCYNLIT